MKRMKAYIMGLCFLLLVACGSTGKRGDVPEHSVVVLHSTEAKGQEDAPFKAIMKKAFDDYHINVKPHHLYLDLLHVPVTENLALNGKAYADSLKKWKPEVILVNEDPALNLIFEVYERCSQNKAREIEVVLDKWFHSIPIVMAGQTNLRKELYNQYGNITGFEDVIELEENIHFFNQITGAQNVNIILDHEDFDNRLRTKLYRQLEASKRYINNGDFHLTNLDANYLKKQFNGNPVVSFYSMRNLESNHAEDREQDDIYSFNRLMENSKRGFHLQVKYDVESNTLIDHSKNPQFTAIRRQFNEENPKFLGGYFSSMETQIKDQVGYAVQILKGAKPKSLALSRHAQDFYLDYRAMKAFSPTPLAYSDWAGKAKILNAPFSVRHVALYLMMVAALILFFSAIAYQLFRWILNLYRKEDVETLHQLEREDERRKLTLATADAHLWFFEDGMLHLSKETANSFGVSTDIPEDVFLTYVLDDSKLALEVLANMNEHKGRNKIRLHIAWGKKKKHTHWYELSFNCTRDNLLTKSLMGISINIDDVVNAELQLRNIQEEINESDQKQNFLNNISHDLRTPLGAVTGFAQLISSEDMDFSPEELAEFNSAISENSVMMQKMIASVIEQSQTDSAELLIKPLKSSTSQLMSQVFKTHQVLVPHHLELKLELEENDKPIWIDPNKTRQVINNFISNAFKFTPTGSVTIGWKYLTETEEVMIYCRDTGIGVSEEDQQRLFDRFYKVHEEARGTGLGLNISRTIIEKQGGTIGVYSTLGKGSTFWFRLKEYKGE